MKQTTGRASKPGVGDYRTGLALALLLLGLAEFIADSRADNVFFTPIPLPECSSGLAIQLDPREPRNGEYLGDPEAYREGEGRVIADAFISVCRLDEAHRQLLIRQVEKIYIHYAAGRYNATPRLTGHILTVDTAHDDSLNARLFTRKLRQLLEHNPPL